MRLKTDIYTQSATELAPLLLGKLLCRKLGNTIIKSRITETEAYMPNDTACHANKGMTPRNSVMFEQGGVTYVYLCYGMHNMLNIVTGKKGSPQAVLIRGIEGYDGPGKLTKYLKIDRQLNAIDLTASDELWIESDCVKVVYEATPRIGIDYADKVDRDRLWRFIASDIRNKGE
jgi:DNA-3-methyladenine glycosylase